MSDNPQPAPLTEGELAEIEQRVEAATPGPWWIEDSDDTWQLFGGEAAQILKAPKDNTPYAEYWPDAFEAALIVNAPTDLARLLTTIRTQQAQIEQAVAERDRLFELLVRSLEVHQDSYNFSDTSGKCVFCGAMYKHSPGCEYVVIMRDMQEALEAASQGTPEHSPEGSYKAARGILADEQEAPNE